MLVLLSVFIVLLQRNGLGSRSSCLLSLTLFQVVSYLGYWSRAFHRRHYVDIGNTAAPPLGKEINSVFLKVLGKVKDLLEELKWFEQLLVNRNVSPEMNFTNDFGWQRPFMCTRAASWQINLSLSANWYFWLAASSAAAAEFCHRRAGGDHLEFCD